jgi:hypothetical protein
MERRDLSPTLSSLSQSLAVLVERQSNFQDKTTETLKRIELKQDTAVLKESYDQHIRVSDTRARETETALEALRKFQNERVGAERTWKFVWGGVIALLTIAVAVVAVK